MKEVQNGLKLIEIDDMIILLLLVIQKLEKSLHT